MTTNKRTSTNTTRYGLAGALLVLGTFLLQFESNGPRFTAVLAIVIAAILFFKPRLLNRMTDGGSVDETDSPESANTDT